MWSGAMPHKGHKGQKRLPQELKVEALRRVAQGQKQRDVAAQLDLNTVTLSGWVVKQRKRLGNDLPAAVKPAAVKAVRAKPVMQTVLLSQVVRGHSALVLDLAAELETVSVQVGRLEAELTATRQENVRLTNKLADSEAARKRMLGERLISSLGIHAEGR